MLQIAASLTIIIDDPRAKAKAKLALLKKSSTCHEFGKIWSNLAIKKNLNLLEVLSLLAFVVNHSK
jgi:hypothetical protein